jgi:hypothetical protein
LTSTFKPGPLCGALFTTVGAVSIVVVVVTGGGVVVTGRTGLLLTGASVEGEEVVTAGRSVVVVRLLLPLPVFRGGVLVAI